MTKRKRMQPNTAPQRPSKKPKPAPSASPAAASAASAPTVPFAAQDRILLVGEGDFSFAKAIVEHHGCCDVTATCLDSREDLFEKYTPQAEQHVRYLEDEGQGVLYAVDATKLDSHKALKKGQRFDRILFNFPHVGGKTKDVNRQVRFNQELLVNFFSSAAHLLIPNGTIIVTIFEGEPYTLWNIKDLARHKDLVVQTSFKFSTKPYPGYSHARTLGNIDGGGGWKGEDRSARTYVFRRKETPPAAKPAHGEKRRKRGDSDESSSDG